MKEQKNFLWRIFYYSRFGVEVDIGCVIAGDNLDHFNYNKVGMWIEGQPSALSRDVICENE